MHMREPELGFAPGIGILLALLRLDHLLGQHRRDNLPGTQFLGTRLEIQVQEAGMEEVLVY